MDLKKLDNKDFLQEIALDKDLLLDEIKFTRGFILEKMKNANIFPALDMLMDNLNPWLLQFITENYSLSREDHLKVAAYLRNSQMEPSAPNPGRLGVEQIEQCLIENQPLPATVVLSAHQINRFKEELSFQQKTNPDNMEVILKTSARSFKVQDFMEVDRDFLRDNLFMAYIRASLFKDEAFKEYYKELCLEKAALDAKPVSIDDFRTWQFQEKDRDFLWMLLDNETQNYISHYDSYTRIAGFSSLITPVEFFTNFNSNSLEGITVEEIHQHKSSMQQAVLAGMQERSYIAQDLVNYIDCSAEQFAALFDKDFFAKLLQHYPDMRISALDDDNSLDLLDKFYYSLGQMIGCFTEQPSSDLYTMFHMVNMFSKAPSRIMQQPLWLSIGPQTQSNITALCEATIEKYGQSSHLHELIDDFSYVFNVSTWPHLQGSLLDHANVNLLYVLSMVYANEIGSKTYKHNHASAQLHVTDVGQSLVAMANLLIKENPDNAFSIGLIVQMLEQAVKDNIHEEDLPLMSQLHHLLANARGDTGLPQDSRYAPAPNNFIIYEGIDLREEPQNLWSERILLRPEFLQEINHQGVSVNANVLKECLYNIEHGIMVEEIMFFLKDYVALHRDEIESDEVLRQAFLTSAVQAQIFPQEKDSESEEAFFQFQMVARQRVVTKGAFCALLDLAKQQGIKYEWSRSELNLPPIEMDEIDENLPVEMEELSVFGLKVRLADLKQKFDYLDNMSRNMHKEFSFEFIAGVVEQSLIEKDFATLDFLNEQRLLAKHFPIISDYLNNCSYEQLMQSMSNAAFSSLVLKEDKIKKATALNGLTDEQSMSIVQQLLDSPSCHTKLEDICQLFAPSNRSFIKEFIIEREPEKVFFDYSFEYSKEDYGIESFIKQPYSFEELHRAYCNLEKKGGLLTMMDTNIRYAHHLSHNFFRLNYQPDLGDEATRDQGQYIEFMNQLKRCSPKFYAICAHLDVFNNSLKNKAGEKKKKSQLEHEFFMSHLDVDVVLTGLRELVQDAKRLGEDKCNKSMLGSILTSFHALTYYETSTGCFESQLSEEKTIEIFKFFYQHSPSILLCCSGCGNIASASEMEKFFHKHISHFSSFDDIHGFIFPDRLLETSYLNFAHNPYARKRLTSFTNSLANHACETADQVTLEFMRYVLKQQHFMNTELSHLEPGDETISLKTISEIVENPTIVSMLESSLNKVKMEKVLPEKSPSSLLTTKRRKI